MLIGDWFVELGDLVVAASVILTGGLLIGALLGLADRIDLVRGVLVDGLFVEGEPEDGVCEDCRRREGELRSVLFGQERQP